jgi:hypothetical protein
MGSAKASVNSSSWRPSNKAERERVLVGQHHQQEMEEDDDAQSHDENQRKRKQRTDGRQLQQHSSVVRWIWREKKNELEEESEEGREGHTHLSQA